MKFSYKKSEEKNWTSNSAQATWPFYEELDRILAWVGSVDLHFVSAAAYAHEGGENSVTDGDFMSDNIHESCELFDLQDAN